MSYLKISTMEYPLYEGDIRLTHPNIKEGQTGDAFPIPDDYVAVTEVDPPTNLNRGQYVVATAPIEVNGVWQQNWEVRTLTEEEILNIEEQIKIARAAELAKLTKNVVSTNVSGSTPDVIE